MSKIAHRLIAFKSRKDAILLYGAISFLCFALAFVGTTSALAQKRRLISGSMAPLTGQKSYDLKFTYDDILIGRDIREVEYLESKRREWEAKEKGKGDAFVEKWYNDRARLYEPAFAKSFENYCKIKLNDTTAKYTLVIRTKHIEGGWNIVVEHYGLVEGEMWIVESADQSKVIARIMFSDFLGTDPYGGDFEMTRRIKSAYEVLGKGLGDYVRNKTR
jgi:hypothetical protein